MDNSELKINNARLFRHFFAAVAVWTFVSICSLAWNTHNERQQTLALVRNAAISSINKDLAFRLWVASHGGVYVPVDENTPPNPFLSQVHNRDIPGPNGVTLTLMNPAYALRQMMEQSTDLYGVKGHITSTKYFRVETAPDNWEKIALTSFERGAKEVFEVSAINGEQYLRLMLPMITKLECLRCHGHQGYKEGDVRGGVSVSVPMKSYLAIEKRNIDVIRLSHLLFYLLGLGTIGFVGWRTRTRAIERLIAREQLRLSEENFRDLYNNAPCGYHSIIEDGTFAQINETELNWIGYSREEVIGKLKWQDLLTPESKASFDRNFELFRSQGWVRDCEYEIIRKDATVFPILLSATAINGDDGKFIMSRATVYDITAKKRAENELERYRDHLEELVRERTDELTKASEKLQMEVSERKRREQEIEELNVQLKGNVAQLEDANEELQSFVYSVSHDLRQPLRTISAFSDIVTASYADKIDEKGNDYLTRIHDGAIQMSLVIDDMLHLAMVSRKGITVKKDVDICEMATTIIAKLRQTQPGRTVETEIKEGMTAFADPGLLELALLNLIENAWKFTEKTEIGRIEIGDIVREGKIVFYVKDNGCGFDQRYADKMFKPFHRLHANDAYVGTGIGLTIVERVIRRHGGLVWAEGQKDKGAAVFFTLD